MSSAAAELHRELAGLGGAQRADAERRYLKSELVHLGVPVPAVRSIARRFARTHPDLTHDGLIQLCDALWAEPVHERRLLAIELLALEAALLDVDDLAWIERHLREAGTWALVDPLAGGVAAGLAGREPVALDRTDRWVHDVDVWIRRSAVLVLRGPLRAGWGWDRFVLRADELLDDPTTWVRKAIGWVAREHGRRHPEEVSSWATAVLPRLSRVTIREAVKPLPDAAALMERWEPPGGGRSATPAQARRNRNG